MQQLSLVFSTLALGFSVVSLMCKDKNTILLFQIPANMSYSLSYLFCGAIVASIGVVVATIRTIVFFVYSTKTKIAPVGYLIVFLILTAGASLVGLDSAVDILPIVGMCTFTYATWQPNERVLKVGAMVLSCCLLAYNCIVGLYISCVQEAILLMCAVVSLAKINKAK